MSALRRLILLNLFILMGLLLALPSQAPGAAQSPPIRSPRLGLTFISSLENPANELRYQRALLLGAGWNRWPLYWDRVERAPGVYDWSSYDRITADDIRHGLRINAILLGRPGFHAEGGSIQGLTAPVFADGSDLLAAGKAPNAANLWGLFVYNAVARYKPGGALAVAQGWPPDVGITVWEAWNEPDLAMFWNGSVEDYARLLKVTYLAAHAADPNARVMFGGLAYGNPDERDWLAETLAALAQDGGRGANNWYMDAVAVHNYADPARSGRVVERVQENLARYGLSRPVWLNESGLSVWNDYPGAIWAGGAPETRLYRGTQAQQAAFVAQSTLLAWAAGADVVFVHQLYDDCGNQPGNFPPHNGELCSAGGLCAGDAYGLYRNERGTPCFSQHPLPGSPRPAASAYYRLAQLFGSLPFTTPALETRPEAVVMQFERPTTQERIVALWNRTGARVEVALNALGTSAMLYALDEQDYSLTPTDGQYVIGLPPAPPEVVAGIPAGAVGGPVFFLVERMTLPTPAPITPTTGSVISTPAPRPTTPPEQDVTPPETLMLPLPVISPAVFTVRWGGQDDGGIGQYVVWVRIDGGAWEPWLETAEMQADYSGEAGRRYEFAVWAVDLAGNWSLNVELAPQAVTTVQ